MRFMKDVSVSGFDDTWMEVERCNHSMYFRLAAGLSEGDEPYEWFFENHADLWRYKRWFEKSRRECGEPKHYYQAYAVCCTLGGSFTEYPIKVYARHGRAYYKYHRKA